MTHCAFGTCWLVLAAYFIITVVFFLFSLRLPALSPTAQAVWCCADLFISVGLTIVVVLAAFTGTRMV